MAKEIFTAGDVVVLKSDVATRMTIENINEEEASADCVWLHPKTKTQKKGSFLLITIKKYKNPAGVTIIKR